MEKSGSQPGRMDDDLYEEHVRKIMSAVKHMSFDQATKLVEVEDEGLRLAIIDDALKLLIAEMHFTAGKPLKELSEKLRLPIKRIEAARAEMMKEVEAAAIDHFKSESGGPGSFGNA